MTSSCVLMVALVLCSPLYVKGVRFRVNGGSFFTTTEPIDIHNVATTSWARGLICQSENKTTASTIGSGNWFLHPEDQTTAESDKILRDGDRGWFRNKTTTDFNYTRVSLKRQLLQTALEGRFTCRITGDSNPIRSIYVLYPIFSVIASIVVVSARIGEFRVQCSSTGGRALSMTVSGPDGYSSDITYDIQPVGTPTRTGSDEYSASTSVVLGGNDRDEYECTATGSTSYTGSIQLRVANAPIISLERTAHNTVRVVWSQPTGGATVTNYVIRYTDSSGSVGSVTVDADSNSTDITGLTVGETYSISVQAKSIHLSGESEEMTVTLDPLLATPESLMLDTVNSTSVIVSWETVDGSDKYTVTFIRATGADQLGGCPRGSHNASVSVDAPATTASIDIGKNVESTNMLRAYSRYFITMVALSNTEGPSGISGQISVFTPQIGAAIPPSKIVITVDSSTRISVQWNPLKTPCNGIITSYKIWYTAQSNGRTHTTDQTEITLTGLTPFTNYSIQIAAVNEEGDVGVYSEAEYVMTDEDIPGPVGHITAFPSFFMITITWEEPEMRNGIIANYEVVYGPKDSPQFIITEDVTAGTTFTTPDDLERGAEYTFTVTAHTSVGPGEPTTVNYFTLERPPAVERVRFVLLNDSSANISWNALIIHAYPIDTYTVVYSPVSQRYKRQEKEEEEMVFPGTVTSAVITGLDSSVNYQFQVFATVILNGQSLEGERSTAEATTMMIDTESDSSGGSLTSLIIGVVFGIIGVAVGVSGLVLAAAMFRTMRASKGESGMSTENNVAYGLSRPYDMRAENNGDYEMPNYMQSLPLPHGATTQETLHEGVY